MYPNIVENRKNPVELFENWKIHRHRTDYFYTCMKVFKSYEALKTKSKIYVKRQTTDSTDGRQQTAVCGLITSKKKSKCRHQSCRARESIPFSLALEYREMFWWGEHHTCMPSAPSNLTHSPVLSETMQSMLPTLSRGGIESGTSRPPDTACSTNWAILVAVLDRFDNSRVNMETGRICVRFPNNRPVFVLKYDRHVLRNLPPFFRISTFQKRCMAIV